jgi:hypothetical protein
LHGSVPVLALIGLFGVDEDNHRVPDLFFDGLLLRRLQDLRKRFPPEPFGLKAKKLHGGQRLPQEAQRGEAGSGPFKVPGFEFKVWQDNFEP